MKKFKYLAILAGMMFSPALSFAQEVEKAGVMSTPWNLDKGILWGIYILIAILLILTIFLYRVSDALVDYMKGETRKERQSFWGSLFQVRLSSTDKDVMMDHSYDGITELDNPPPPWFMWFFYGTIVVAVVYFVRFQVTGNGPTQAEEYLAEVAEHEAMLAKGGAEAGSAGGIDETKVELLTAAADLKSGSDLYTKLCIACHGDKGQGNIGPNLTDEFWIHGGSVSDVYKTIKNGVLEKGMQSWQHQLKPLEMQQVTSFILSLQGSNPPGAKAPEGEKYVPEGSPAAPAADSTGAQASL